MNKIVLITCLLFLGYTSLLQAANTKYLNDFELAWNLVNNNYAYFDDKTTNWRQVYQIYKPRVEKAQANIEFVANLYDMIEELYDSHAFVRASNLAEIPPGLFYRQAPEGSDFWAEFRNEKPIITGLVKGMSAEQAGLRLGMEIIEINNTPVEGVIKSRLEQTGTMNDHAAKAWAINTALAGAWGSQRTITTKLHGVIKTYKLDLPQHKTASNFSNTPHVEWKSIANTLGYINIRNLQDPETIARFDEGLNNLKDSKGLVIDLRETRLGGNTFIARAILGRFINKELPYQKHLKQEKMDGVEVTRSWLEMVSPRGDWQYHKPIVVLVNYWTASMGEGIAIAFDGLQRATVIGTRMGRLAGAVQSFTLPNTGIVIGFPTEKLFHIKGTAREHYTPNILIDLLNDKYAEIDDPIYQVGLSVLTKKTAKLTKELHDKHN